MTQDSRSWFPCCSPAVRGQGGDKPPAVRGQAPCCAGTSPLLCGDKPPAVRGQAPRWSEMHSRSWGLSEAQVQACEDQSGPR
jgi:hypothetical protein